MNIVPISSETKAKVTFVEKVNWRHLINHCNNNNIIKHVMRGQIEAATIDPKHIIETCSELLADLVYLEPGDYLLRYSPYGNGNENKRGEIPTTQQKFSRNSSGNSEHTEIVKRSKLIPTADVYSSTCKQDIDSFNFHRILDCQAEGIFNWRWEMKDQEREREKKYLRAVK